MSQTAFYTAFEFELEGFPAVAVINKDLADPSRQQKYPTAVFVEIVPDVYNANGHPEPKEYDYLVEAENKMMEYLETQTETVHVGHVTFYRHVQIIFYTKEAEKVEGFLNYFLSTIERQAGVETERDPEWDGVSAFYALLNDENAE